MKNTLKSISFTLSPIALVLMLLSFNAKASSETELTNCLKKVYSSAYNSKLGSKDLVKAVTAGTKQCKDAVKSMIKAEKEAKKRGKLEAQLKKLQEKLSKIK